MTVNVWRRFAWVNVWMIGFGTAGLWLVLSEPVPAVVFAVVVLVGLLRLPVSLFYGWGERGGSNLNDLARLYLDAWKQLWRQRWILWIFGLVALLMILAALMGEHFAAVLLSDQLDELRAEWSRGPVGSVTSMPIGDRLRLMLPGSLASSSMTVVGRFVPGTGFRLHPLGTPLFALLLLASAGWLNGRLKSLARESEYAREARFIQTLIVPLAVVSVALAVVLPREHWLMLREMAKDGARPYSVPVLVLSVGGLALLSLVVNGALIGALAGSLRRVAQSDRVTGDTFFRDSVRYFRPIAGVYLFLALVGVIVTIPTLLLTMGATVMRSPSSGSLWMSLPRIWGLVSLIFMFVVYAPVIRGTGAWGSIRQGLADWFSHIGEVVSFVALGFTFLMVPVVVLDLSERLLGIRMWPSPFTAGHWLTLAVSGIELLVWALLAAFMAVAVWEFYWRITQAGRSGPPAAEAS